MTLLMKILVTDKIKNPGIGTDGYGTRTNENLWPDQNKIGQRIPGKWFAPFCNFDLIISGWESLEMFYTYFPENFDWSLNNHRISIICEYHWHYKTEIWRHYDVIMTSSLVKQQFIRKNNIILSKGILVVCKTILDYYSKRPELKL